MNGTYTNKANEDIRVLMMINNVRMWQVAKKVGISEAWFCKKMRSELEPDYKDKVMTAIREIISDNS